jgi:hypothetical protein
MNMIRLLFSVFILFCSSVGAQENPVMLGVGAERMLSGSVYAGLILNPNVKADSTGKQMAGYALQLDGGARGLGVDFGFGYKEFPAKKGFVTDVFLGLSYRQYWENKGGQRYFGACVQYAPALFSFLLGFYIPLTGSWEQENLDYLWNVGIGFSVL